MTERNSYTVVCVCCELDVLASRAAEVVDGWCCPMCRDGHRGDRLQKARDHEDELRARLAESVEDLRATEDLVEDARHKMKAAFRSRDAVLRQFARLSRYHQVFEDGCICGKRYCETLTVIDADWINDRIALMVQQHRAG